MFKKFVTALASAVTVGLVSITLAQAETGATVEAPETVSRVAKSGVFEGRSDHITTGGVSILKTESGYIAVLEADFDLDGAPAPTLGFGKSGKKGFVKKTEFTKLKSDKGLQVYSIPAKIDPADYDQFYVWCSDFDVALGVAALR